MITLSAPCRALMDRDPLTVRPDDLLADVADDDQGRPLPRGRRASTAAAGRSGSSRARTSSTRSRARVLLVDHAEQAQSVPGVEQAEIVEILDHHHIGSIETRVPVRATFDPVGSTATLVIERFRQNGMEPSRPTAMMLLGAILSDTVILNSPTTTERDHAVIEYLERVLALDAEEFGREMFEETLRPSDVPADELVGARRQGVRGRRRPDDRDRAGRDGRHRPARPPRRAARRAATTRASATGYALYALMVTDILAKGTKLLVSGDAGAARARVRRARPTTA